MIRRHSALPSTSDPSPLIQSIINSEPTQCLTTAKISNGVNSLGAQPDSTPGNAPIHNPLLSSYCRS